MSSMDRWLCRLLDTDEEITPRICLVSDYWPALRVLGYIRPGLEQAWRGACVTPDPLTAGGVAVGQLRAFLALVEQQVGDIPASVPQVDCAPTRDELQIRRSRRSWADNVMAVVLNIGAGPRATAPRESIPQPEEEDPAHSATRESVVESSAGVTGDLRDGSSAMIGREQEEGTVSLPVWM